MKLRMIRSAVLALVVTAATTAVLAQTKLHLVPESQEQARVRFIHASPDAPEIDVLFDGSEQFSNTTFGEISDYTDIPAGTYEVTIRLVGTDTPALATTVALTKADYTLAAAGTLAAGGKDFELMVLLDNNSAPPPGMVRVRGVHLVPDAPAPITVVRENDPLFRNVVYGDVTEYATLSAGSHYMRVLINGYTLGAGTVTIEADSVYSNFGIGLAYGTPQPQYVEVQDRFFGGDPPFSISGQVRDASGAGIDGVTVSAGAGRSATTDAGGAYTITSLVTGTYTLTPSKNGWTFSPETRTVSVPPDATGQDFVGQAVPWLELTGIEVTQGIQNWENEVVLIEDRPTVVRAHVRSTAGTVPVVTAMLIGRRGGVELPLSPLFPSNAWGAIHVRENPSRLQLNDSFYFVLPQSWRGGAIELELRGISHPLACRESAGGDGDCTVELAFVESPAAEANLIGVIWRENGIRHQPSLIDISAVAREIDATFPIPHVDWDWPYSIEPAFFAGQPSQPWQFVRLTQMLKMHRTLDGCISSWPVNCKRYYLGVLVNPPREGRIVLGMAAGIPADVATAYLTDGLTPSHELGHCTGRYHTDYNAQRELDPPEAGPRYHQPTDGTISQDKVGGRAVYGFDMRTGRIYGPDTPDLMSYARPRWPSPWTYTHIRDHLVARYGDSTATVAVLAQEPAVVVSGAVTPTAGTGTLESIFAFDAPVSASAPDPGTYAIRFEDAGGDELAVYSFEPNYPLASCVGCADYGESNVGTFALFLPWDANAARMVLLHNEQELDSRTASANPPTVTVVHPNGGEFLTGSSTTLSWSASDPDGDPLEYAVQYSTDAGASWQTLASAWVSTTYELNLEAVAGTDEGLLRVLASDGFHTSEARSEGTFAVAKRPPNVSISSPPDDSLFVGNQTIILEGGAYDNEDGQLGDSALSWSSDLDGALGTGRSVAIVSSHLSEGTHTITLSAQDSDGQSDAASITVQIYRERPELPSTLAVAPDGITLVGTEGSWQTASEPIFIRNDGDGTMTWSAATDQDWILMSALEGTAPSDVSVIADVSGLSIGEHTGTITVTASGAVNSPQTVGVTLFVTPPRDTIYLPLVLRNH